MRYICWLPVVLLCGAMEIAAQELAADELTPQEQAVIEAIKAQNRTEEEDKADKVSAPTVQSAPMQAPPAVADKAAESGDITLSEHTKQQAWDEQQQNQPSPAPDAEPVTAAADIAAQPDDLSPDQAALAAAADATPVFAADKSADMDEKDLKQCLTVAFIDIDIAFNEHPRTQTVKQQIDIKIKAKEREVENAKDIIAALEAENKLLSRQLAELKPFYERIVTDQELEPKVPESADTLELVNVLNRLIFSGAEMITTSPLNSPAQLDDVTERIGANKKIIAERHFFIDNYKYQTREEILNLEKEEVKNILQDIYTEIKSFAKKRNIGAVVRKDEILYGQQPVNVTKDFVSTLKKSKKYRKKK